MRLSSAGLCAKINLNLSGGRKQKSTANFNFIPANPGMAFYATRGEAHRDLATHP